MLSDADEINDNENCDDNEQYFDINSKISNISLKSGSEACLKLETSESGQKIDIIADGQNEIKNVIEENLIVIQNDVLNLSKQNLSEFPESWLKIENLDLVQKLILEGNQLLELPKNFFTNLPLLKWIDLRNNHLTSLPKEGLKNHESLEVILLENNQIKSLPAELGTINSLKAVNVRNNPLEYPPSNVMEGGIGEIKQFLSNAHFQGSQEQDSDKNQNNTNNNADHIVGGSKVNDGRKTKKLFSLHSKLCKKKSKQLSMKKICKTQSEKYLNSSHRRPISENILEERFQEEVKLAKLKQRMLKREAELQAQKTKDNVQKWKEKYKKMQFLKIDEKMSNGGRLDFEIPASSAPFGVSSNNFRMISNNERIFNKMNRERKIKPCNMSLAKKIQLENAKLNHEKFLKSKLEEHILSMKSRSYSNMEPHQIRLTAEKDLEITLKLQEEINKRRKELEFGTSRIPSELFN